MYTIFMDHKKIPDKLFLEQLPLTFKMVCNDHLKNNDFHPTKSNIQKYEI